MINAKNVNLLEIILIQKMKYIYTILLSLAINLSYTQEITAQEFQNNLNKDFANKLKSPLHEKDLKVFKSLDFYPINQIFIVEAKFKKFENEKIFEMKTSTERKPKYLKYGELSFEINAIAYKLFVYQNQELVMKPGYEDYLFLPFSDLTCGKESYIGGRYIDMKIPKTESVIINFNKAYNPYCAYNHNYSCPIVPLENDLNTEILAGVKKFHD